MMAYGDYSSLTYCFGCFRFIHIFSILRELCYYFLFAADAIFPLFFVFHFSRLFHSVFFLCLMMPCLIHFPICAEIFASGFSRDRLPLLMFSSSCYCSAPRYFRVYSFPRDCYYEFTCAMLRVFHARDMLRYMMLILCDIAYIPLISAAYFFDTSDIIIICYGATVMLPCACRCAPLLCRHVAATVAAHYCRRARLSLRCPPPPRRHFQFIFSLLRYL